MTPRELDRSVVQARLRQIEELLGDLESVGDVSVEVLRGDRMLRHAVERVLSQIVELAVSVNSHIASTVLGQAPSDYRSSFRLMVDAGVIDENLCQRLQPSVGLRNVLAHEYLRIDLALVAAAVGRARTYYREYVGSAATWLTEA